MTTNHPAHGPVSLERLHQISEILSKAAAQSDGGNLGYAMADAVKVIDGVIAAFDAEPVAIVQPSDYVTAAELVGEEQTRKAVHELYEGALRIGDKLYRHPQEWQSKQMSCPKCNDTGIADSGGVQPWGEPISVPCDCDAAAPVLSDDARQELSKMDDEIVAELDEEERACRSAMLQGSEPVSKSYKFPPNSFTDEDLEMMAHGNNPQSNAYRELLEFRRNSPVTPDGLLGCGENCWSCGKYFTYEQHSECDGYCPHCNSPVDLDDEEDQPSKVVPTNPTEEMISNAWREAIGKCDHETIKRIYAAMLASAPTL